MIKASSGREGRTSFAIGLILVCVGIVCNEWILAKVFSSDGVLELSTRVKICVFNITLITIGLSLTKYNKSKEAIHQFFRLHPRILDSLIGVVITIVMLLCVEGVFYALNYYRNEDIKTTWTETLKQPDQLLGYKPRPNVQVSATKTAYGKVLYDVTYSIDEYSRRITLVKNLGHRPDSVLFFGGSFTFGEGVNDNETLPFYVSELAPHHRSYNYGFRGYGPHQMLAKLQSSGITQEVNEAHVILIYTLLDAHIARATGSMRTLEWGHHTPYYIIDDDGGLVRKGNFTSGRPIVTFLYRAIGRTQFFKYFTLDYPSISDNHIRTTARIIEESRNAFRDKFRSDDFYVLIYPDYGARYATKMIPYFESAGIKYLDYSDLIDTSGKEFHIDVDEHPSAYAYMTIATRLAKDIGILGGVGEE